MELHLPLCLFLILVTLAAAEEKSSQEDSKEKRSQEEILFGNQQNKPNGLVDDLMSMSESAELDKKSNDSQAQELKSEGGTEERQDDVQNDMMMSSGAENWYNAMPASPTALQYLTNAQALKHLPSDELYDQEDVYRRKRQIPIRSLRSSLGQMIQKRGIRMPRRSMRLKRQVDMEDLINFFGNDEAAQVTPHSFSGRARTVSKRHVPRRFSGYPEGTPEYRYPYVFQHRDEGILQPEDETEDDANFLLLHPKPRYVETAQDILPYRSRDEENAAVQKWLTRHTIPSVFRVSRRSSPFFYPIDYRYIPAQKRSSRGSSGLFAEEEEPDVGKWGHVVQVPEAYASPEDIARLYGLASLMSEGDDGEDKMRRSA